MPVDHYENFPVASLLLPARLRYPVTVIYHVARHADDLADEGEATPEARLAALAECRAELDRIAAGTPAQTERYQRLAAVVSAHQLPLQCFYDLLDAFSQDVVKTRYADYDELRDYCHRSADPVGRLMLHLFGCATPANIAQSDAICTALQLINFWQDVAIDWQKNRVYLPQSDLVQFGVTEAEIARGQDSPAWRALMAFQIERTRALMLSGASLVHQLPGRFGWEIRLTVQGGLQILDRITAVNGDVFHQRPKLGAWDWLRLGLRACVM